MITISIIGGAGYVAGELIRILINHPNVIIQQVISQSHHGEPICSVHRDLIGESELVFSRVYNQTSDVVFLCLGHGKSKQFLIENPISENTKIIDLSQDFRDSIENKDFTYGLSEVFKNSILKANKIANPGCFATAIELALAPLAKLGELKKEIHVHAVTGSSGSGQSPCATSHFSWRNNNISIYKAFAHQHLLEIKQTMKMLDSGFREEINFIPMRGGFSRGIFTSIYFDSELTIETIINIYSDFYQDSPFVFISNEEIDLKMVVNTNKCVLHIEKHSHKVHITGVIDNLIKGAAGQAVQNMNLMCSMPEQTGLLLKSIVY